MDRTDIDVSDDGAQRLARLGEGLTDDQVDALLGAAEAQQEGSITRREFAKAAGALGVGGVLGGGAVGTAAADASTTDDDGNVGRPDDRVDVFSDGVDANSVSTDNLTLTPLYEELQTFTGGETKNRNPSEIQDVDKLLVSAVPNNNPGNDHGYRVDSYYLDDADIKVRITETENEGGGEARVIYYMIQTP